MKRFLNIALCIILIATPCFATLPGPLSIIKCPKCGQPIMDDYIWHVVFLGAEYHTWTDGKVISYNKFNKWDKRAWKPLLAKCPTCSNLFWITMVEDVARWNYSGFWESKDEKNQWHKLESGSEDELIKKVLYPCYLEENDYLEVITWVGGNKKTEKYLRIRAWFSVNDRLRYSKQEDVPVFSAKTIENLQRLSSMLDEKDENERIMKAEIARELGQFDTSIALLKHDFSERLAKAAAFIMGLSESKDTRVREIPKDADPSQISGPGHAYGFGVQ